MKISFLGLEPFATKLQPTVHKPEVGTSLILRCTPPDSYPEPSIYWGEFKPGSKLRPINNDDRVSLDFDGRYTQKESCGKVCYLNYNLLVHNQLQYNVTIK